MLREFNNKIYWVTNHVFDKLVFEGITESEMIEALKNPQREEWDEANQTVEYHKEFGKGKARYTIAVAVDEEATPPVITTVFIVEAW